MESYFTGGGVISQVRLRNVTHICAVGGVRHLIYRRKSRSALWPLLSEPSW
jgi:hypothetical protein